MTRRKRPNSIERNEFIEEMFRPDSRLGYDRDVLGTHLFNCGAYKIAESQFRRAIWLNPFEARFKAHLAWCLYKEERFHEAREWAANALKQAPDEEEIQRIVRMLDECLEKRDH